MGEAQEASPARHANCHTPYSSVCIRESRFRVSSRRRRSRACVRSRRDTRASAGQRVLLPAYDLKLEINHMNGGLMKTSRFALAAVATALMGTSALAADLGGNCCADLEERIAELEATTVRKGNRKVSLQISGYVSHHVMFWDDGGQSDTYIGDGGNYGSRWRFKGEAKINAELTAGFLYEYTAFANSISSLNQLNGGDDLGASGGGTGTGGTPGNLALRDSTVWLKHSRLGMVKVGHGSTATDNLVLIDLGGVAGAATPDVALYNGGFILRHANGALSGSAGAPTTAVTWNQIINGGESWDTTRRNHVLYETPTLHGFSLQAAVAEDNYWDVALRYAGEFNGVRIAFGIGYREDTEFNAPIQFAGVAPNALCNLDCNRMQSAFLGSGSILHTPTGLFLTVAAGKREHERAESLLGSVDNRNADASFWYLSGGVARNFFGIGNTVLFAEYGNHEDGLRFVRNDVTTSEVTNWGLGIVQNIDAAAMEVFLVYKNFEADFTQNTGTLAAPVLVKRDIQDFSTVIIGTRIQF
ncbi:MAG: porin [Hyphomicrobiaceae bacterium]